MKILMIWAVMLFCLVAGAGGCGFTGHAIQQATRTEKVTVVSGHSRVVEVTADGPPTSNVPGMSVQSLEAISDASSVILAFGLLSVISRGIYTFVSWAHEEQFS